MAPRASGAALLATLLAAAPAAAQSASASLAVRLAWEDGEPLADATAVLEGAGATRLAVTDARGETAFLHLRPGRYRLTARGHEPRLGTLVDARAGHDCHLEVLLSRAVLELVEEPPGTGVCLEHAHTFTAFDLPRMPRPANAWAVLRDVPGVAVDRVDVGGSETALQSLVVSHGDGGTGTAWTLDGVDVTDPAAVGATAIFPEIAFLEAIDVRTGAFDVRVRTPGVQVGLQLREPAPRLQGGAHLRGAGDALQADNLPAALAGRPFLQNRTRDLLEAGAEAGGPLRDGRLWLWGALGRSALRQSTFTEHDERLSTTTLAAKARWLFEGGALSLLALRNEKVHEDRDPGLSAAPEARWRQSGPAHVVGAEARRTRGNASLLAQLAYLDGGFRLDPQGGTRANPLEDFRGVFQGSYSTLVTDRPRLQGRLEAASGRWAFGFDHGLRAGLGYRRSAVTTRAVWPGNQVLALERQNVFFRAFQLTGFALPTRGQDARSVHDLAEAYAQDTARRGRLTLFAGARLDRQSGHNRPSAVEANPLVPDLLPAVSFAGSPARFRWLDLLPRAGLGWDLDGDGSWQARVGYAAYGATLAAGDITFDNPIGRETSSLTYYWLDRNGDHAVQAEELDLVRGRLGTAGMDPRDPSSTVSPHAVDPAFRAPRTHEISLGMEGPLAGGARFGLQASWRRLRHVRWAPLRGLGLADYVARGSVEGTLAGRPYQVVFFAPASESRIVPGNGRLLTNREGYRQEALVAEAEVAGGVGPRVQYRAWAAFTDGREYFEDNALAIQDPTPTESEPLQDAGRLAVRPGGLGRGDVFVNARWSAGATVAGSLPGSLQAAAHLHARDGFPVPYFQVGNTGDPTAGAKNVLIAPHLDSFRLPAVVLLDARLARPVPLGRGILTFALDAFNLLNRSTPLQVVRDIELPAFDRPREILRPRILRLGVDYRF